jgi:hypothetical protein
MSQSSIESQRHRRDQRHHLRARVRRPRTIAEIDSLIDQPFDPEPSGERRRQHDPRVRHKPLVIEGNRESIRRDNQRPIVHHTGILPDAGPQLLTSAAGKPCSGRHFSRATE